MLLENNIRVLEERYPTIKEVLENSSTDKNIKIIAAKNGSKSAIYIDGKTEYLIHSKYNPEKEAERLISQLEFFGTGSIIVTGFGMGYHLQELYNKVKEKNIKIFVIESNLTLFQEAIRWNDFTALFSYDNFYLYLINNYNSIELISFIEDHIDIVFERMILFKFPSVERYFGEKLSLVEKDLEFIIKKLEANRYTSKKRGKMWEDNILNNLYLMLKRPGVNVLYQLYEDKPAILVAAGPSLNKNMHLLKEVKNKAIIIAADAVLKVLLKNDIIPDIVTAVDGYKHILKYFTDLDYSKLHNTVLVTVPQFFNHILEEWPGPVVFSPDYGTGEGVVCWLEKYRGFMGRLATGGSVAHLSFAVANVLKANPIVFVGQDLAFTDNITHVKGNDYSLNIEEEMKKRNREYIKLKDINGDEVWTRNDFYFYLEWFNKAIEDLKDNGCQTLFIDATEGGARIEGTEIMPLKKVIEEFCQDSNKNMEQILERLNLYQGNWNREIKDELAVIIKNIERLKKQAEEGLALIDILLGSVDEEKIKNIIGKIKKINDSIKNLTDNIIFFEAEIYKIYDLVNIENKTELDKYSKLVEFYNLIINGSEKAIKILREHYGKIIKE